MSSEKTRPTVDELFELLKRTSLPTVLVEGKDDIIFYRSVEDELRTIDVDMLPAGNKDAVLELKERVNKSSILTPIIFIVDNDLWVHAPPADPARICDVITTNGYSIENDLFSDGDLESLLSSEEAGEFRKELESFSKWYALAVSRYLKGKPAAFRTHPGKVLDDEEFYREEMTLSKGEVYPDTLFNAIMSNYAHLLRGKSLFALLLRQLSATKRDIKFGGKQLMAFGASRKGPNFQRIHAAVKTALEQTSGGALTS